MSAAGANAAISKSSRQSAGSSMKLRPTRRSAHGQISLAFVADRPGHDKRYAIDASKIKRDLGWEPRESFASGLAKTVRWYVDNRLGGSVSAPELTAANGLEVNRRNRWASRMSSANFGFWCRRDSSDARC